MPFIPGSGLGPIAFLGSGETSLSGGRIFESLAIDLPHPLRIAILETPAGFELNSDQVAGRVADFLKTRLQNFRPQVDVIPARKRGTSFSPDNLEILAPLLHANLIFMGPGSPTYAVRQLRGSHAWDILRARHRSGTALVFSSAAVVAVGAYTLPVYEIYKVGLDVQIQPGLDLFADFYLPLSLIPHWNNADGGSDLDTSRCFVGKERYEEWYGQLPPRQTVVGLDEHTGLIMDLTSGECHVIGVSSVTLVGGYEPKIFAAGSTFPMTELGLFKIPEPPEAGISPDIWELVQAAPSIVSVPEEIPPEVRALVEAHQQARQRKDWAAADTLRIKINALGWLVQDTPEGPLINKK